MIPDHLIDTEALRRLAGAAAPGPWHYIPGDHDLASAGIDITAEGDSLTWDDHSGEVFTHPDAEFIAAAREAVPALLDRIARLEAQSDIRGRAVVIYRERARKAEAERDQAYEWADDQSHPLVMRQGEILTGVANALNGPTPARTSWSHHDLAEKAAAMVARAEQAEARIKAVRAIHRDLYESMPGAPYCDSCDRDWPCPTIRALDGDA